MADVVEPRRQFFEGNALDMKNLDTDPARILCGTAMFAWLKKKTALLGPGDVMKRVIVLKHLVVKGLATPPPEYIAEKMKKWSAKERSEFIREVLVKNATLLPADRIVKQRNLAELWHWRSRTRQLQESGKMPRELPGRHSIDQIIQMTAAKAAENAAFPAPIGNDFPAFGKPYRELTPEEFSRATSIAMERHRAFNWLCGYAPGNRWADTPTET